MDKKKFARMYQEYADAIFRHCYFRVQERERARDIVQNTFVKVWEYLSRGEEIKNMKAFLYKVASNQIIDYYRSNKELSLDELREKGFEPKGDLGFGYEDKLDAEAIRSLLTQLNEGYREVMVLRYIDGYKPREMAELMGEDVNVVSVRLHRAAKLFKKICRRNGFDQNYGKF